MSADKTRVVIVGARGIGKHHGRWWTLAGAEVCAHVGTSEASVKAAGDGMHTLYGYAGTGYTSLTECLAAERPDWVDVCSNNACHEAHVREALAAGCQVICEKPLVHQAGVADTDLLATSESLAALAVEQGTTLTLCLQYWFAVRSCLEIFREVRGAEAITAFEFHLASPAKDQAASPDDGWIDLGPHAVSAMQALVSALGHELGEVPAGREVEMGGFRTECRFTTGGIAVTLRSDRTVGKPSHIRRIQLNDMAFDLQGANDATGIYRAVYVYDGGERTTPDTMHQLITAILADENPITPSVMLANQRWLLGLIAAG